MPRNAGAWLTTVAKRKAIDHWRRQDRLDAKYATLAHELETHVDEAWDPDRIDDDVLRLVFISTHPVLARENQIALTLRVVGGLTTEEIARAFLAPKATIAQRIVRAKKTLGDAEVPFEVPDPAEYPQRLSAVLSVIYLIYNEGYSASFGQRWIRDELCSEALRLGRVLAALVPDQAEVHGLVALMEFQSSRFAARTDADGQPVLLEDQDRTRWDRAQIRRGVAALQRAADTLQRKGIGWGPYALQAALAECHAVSPDCRRHRLEAHRYAVRRAAADRAVPGGRTEPGRRGRDGLGPGRARFASSTGSSASTAPICCPACAVNCWRGWGDMPRQPTNSTVRPRRIRTNWSEKCWRTRQSTREGRAHDDGARGAVRLLGDAVPARGGRQLVRRNARSTSGPSTVTSRPS